MFEESYLKFVIAKVSSHEYFFKEAKKKDNLVFWAGTVFLGKMLFNIGG